MTPAFDELVDVAAKSTFGKGLRFVLPTLSDMQSASTKLFDLRNTVISVVITVAAVALHVARNGLQFTQKEEENENEQARDPQSEFVEG